MRLVPCRWNPRVPRGRTVFGGRSWILLTCKSHKSTVTRADGTQEAVGPSSK